MQQRDCRSNDVLLEVFLCVSISFSFTLFLVWEESCLYGEGESRSNGAEIQGVNLVY